MTPTRWPRSGRASRRMEQARRVSIICLGAQSWRPSFGASVSASMRPTSPRPGPLDGTVARIARRPGVPSPGGESMPGTRSHPPSDADLQPQRPLLARAVERPALARVASRPRRPPPLCALRPPRGEPLLRLRRWRRPPPLERGRARRQRLPAAVAQRPGPRLRAAWHSSPAQQSSRRHRSENWLQEASLAMPTELHQPLHHNCRLPETYTRIRSRGLRLRTVQQPSRLQWASGQQVDLPSCPARNCWHD